MITWKEFMNEQAIARNGDYDFGNLNYINNGDQIIAKTGVIVLYEFKHSRSGEKLFVVQLKDAKDYICLAREVIEEQKTSAGEVYRTKERYQLIIAMLLKYTTKYRGLNYGPFRIVKGVETKSNERKKGYGIEFYKSLVKGLKWTLMGDAEQYAGARELWVSLSTHPEFFVDIVDLSNGKLIHKDTKLSDALDSRIWTDEDLMLTGTKEENKVARFNRLVLTNVK